MAAHSGIAAAIAEHDAEPCVRAPKASAAELIRERYARREQQTVLARLADTERRLRVGGRS
jgi:hypothetical protein